MLLKDCAGADRATIILLKADLRRAGRIRYTGRTHDANKLVHIMPLYTAFVCGHVDYFREMYGYELRRDTPGQKAHIFGAGSRLPHPPFLADSGSASGADMNYNGSTRHCHYFVKSAHSITQSLTHSITHSLGPPPEFPPVRPAGRK